MLLNRPALLLLLAAPLLGQFDDRLWLVQGPVVGTTGVVCEIARDGTLIATYAGPSGGSSGVVKDLLQPRVFVADDAMGRILVYRAGVGQVGQFTAPGVKGIALLPNGDIALLVGNGHLQPGAVQIVPMSGNLWPWPPPIPVGLGPARILAGPGGVIWTMNALSSTISRVSLGTVQTISVWSTVPSTLRDITLRPGGGVVVSFTNSNDAVLLDPNGVIQSVISLPDHPTRLAADGDTSLYVLGAQGTIHRVRLPQGLVIDSFVPPAPTDVRALIPDLDGALWVENAAEPSVVKYGQGGAALATVPLPVITNTLGDPLGLEFATKTHPAADVDNDSVPSGEEILRGSDLLDGTSVPPTLSVLSPSLGRFLLRVEAPAFPLGTAIVVVGVSGTAPALPIGLGNTAPYLHLQQDILTELILQQDPTVLSHASGIPWTLLDAAGTCTASIDLTGTNLTPGWLTFSAGAVVGTPADPLQQTVSSVSFAY